MVGVPDELERLWTPHRLAYVVGNGGPPSASPECPFCAAPKRPDEESLIVARGELVYAVLNLYPYNPGHLLICPYRHVPDYTDLDPAETMEFAQFAQLAMTVVRRVSAPHGFNLGMNQGSVAGAGIAVHLHQHVVPRWSGDTNFMPVIGRTKTVPQLLADTRTLLAEAWTAVTAPPRKKAAKKSPPSPTKAAGTKSATKSTRQPTARAAASQPTPSRTAASRQPAARAAASQQTPSRTAASQQTGARRTKAQPARSPSSRSR